MSDTPASGPPASSGGPLASSGAPVDVAALVGAPARETREVLERLVDSARSLLGLVESRTARLAAAVQSAPLVPESPSGSGDAGDADPAAGDADPAAGPAADPAAGPAADPGAGVRLLALPEPTDATHPPPARRIGSDPASAWVLDAAALARLQAQAPGVLDAADDVLLGCAPVLHRMRPASGSGRFFFVRGARRQDVLAALAAAQPWQRWALEHRMAERFEAARSLLGEDRPPASAAETSAALGVLAQATGRQAAPRWPAGADLAAAGATAADVCRVHGAAAAATERVVTGHRRLQREAAMRALGELPVDRLRDTTQSVLRLAALEEAGIRTVGDVLARTPAELDGIPGVGELTARQVVAAAARMAAAVGHDGPVRLDPARPDPAQTDLIAALEEWGALGPAVRRWGTGLVAAARRLDGLAGLGLEPTRRYAVLGESADAATALVERVEQVQRWRQARPEDAAAAHETSQAVARAAGPARPKPGGAGPLADADRSWSAFRADPARYYGWLDEALGSAGAGRPAQQGALPAEIVAAIREVELDTSLLSASLRGYQDFGARFALVQRRVIVGDEMGLGKTLQALAVMAHVAAAATESTPAVEATGRPAPVRSLVVCPAAVLVNWLREVPKHTRLTAYRLHGDDREAAREAWRRDGGVAVTTYGTLESLELTADDRLAVLVADEAHYVKNPWAQRSRVVRALLPQAARVLFLTGTPLENRLEEFARLADYLQPGVLNGLDPAAAAVGAGAFRRAVSPVYLRRNQIEVLTELPERIEVDDWVDLTETDARLYRAAVEASDWMPARRAAFLAGDPRRSAKLDRLVDIVAEATDNGHRVVVFSFFREVLEIVARVLGELVAGADEPRDVASGTTVSGTTASGTTPSYAVPGPAGAGPRGGPATAGDPDEAATRPQDAPALPPRPGERLSVFGPLTGSMSPQHRQELIDAFQSAPVAGVLVSQIEAGGVGTNIQGASVVVLCEPAVKPSTEAQAIARLHRMGQLQTVQVHRLLAEDTVDEWIRRLLAEKVQIFDDYARRSSVAESAPEAVDVSERALATRVMQLERRRLGLPQDGVVVGPQDASPPAAPQDATAGEVPREAPRGLTPQDAPAAEIPRNAPAW